MAYRLGSKSFTSWLTGTLVERLESDGEWMVARNGMYQSPVGWFLKGLAAAHSRDGFYVYAYTHPLVAHAPEFLALNYSRRVFGPETSTFELPSKDTAERVADEVAEAWRAQKADEFIATLGTPDGFLDYVAGYRNDAPSQGPELYAGHGIPAGACHLLLGNEEEARREFSYIPAKPTQDHPQQDVDLAQELLRRLSETGTSGAIERLSSVREQALAAQLKDL